MLHGVTGLFSRGLAGAPYNVLRIELEGELRETTTRVPIPFLAPPRRLALWEVLGVLDEAGADPSVKAVLLTMGPLRMGMATAESLWNALRALRRSGKVVFAFSTAPSSLDFMVASAADHITVPPWAMVNTVGLAAEVAFFGEVLSRWGVAAEFESTGPFKGAAEVLSRSSMSETVRRMMDSLYDGLYERFVGCVAEGRGMDRDAVLAAIDASPLSAAEAVECGLADAVGYEHDVISRLEDALGERARTVDVRRYRRLLDVRDRLKHLWSRLTGSPPVVALVVEEGIITSGSSRRGGGLAVMGARTVLKTLEAVTGDRSVRALVVRLSSPGGSGSASDVIYSKLSEVARRMPVVVSMGDVAASGAYMAAVAAHRIVAHSTTLTGSIGVIAGKISIRRLLEGVGVRHELISRGRHAAIHSIVREYGPSERKKIEGLAGELYERFVTLVAERRGRDRAHIESAAQGRVWLGTEARERGLVDVVGGLIDAVGEAKALAGLAEDQPVVLRHKRVDGPWRLAPLSAAGMGPTPEPDGRAWEALSELVSEPLMAILPFWFRFS